MARHVMDRLPARCVTYYEPLVGGGAVLIEMAKAGRFDRAVVADTNQELVTAWSVIQSDADGLIRELRKKRYVYDKKVFLKIRAEEPDFSDPVKVAARFIFLNRTCFNGLYRVNSEGRFNSPFGRYKDPVICDADNIRALSLLLRKVEIREADFEDAVQGAEPGDAVYFDPPYIPLSSTSNFDKYTARGFDMEAHRRLCRTFSALVGEGVRAVLSNSSAEASLEMYGRFDLDRFTGSRSVGGPADYRKPVEEILVFGGPKS